MRVTIYGKIIAGFGIIIVVMIALGVYLLVELRSVTASIRLTMSTNVLTVDRAKELSSFINDQERHAQQFLVSGDTTYLQLYTTTARQLAAGMDSLSGIFRDPVQDRVIQQLQQTNERLHTSLVAPGPKATISSITDTMDVMRRYLDDVIIRNQSVIGARMVAVERRAEEAGKFSLVITLGTLVITILVALLVAQTITRPIRALKAGTTRIARGSFDSITVRSHDEIADLATAFNEMTVKLRQSNEYKAEMMQHIAHELRTPLQSLQSVYYLLEQQIAGPVNDQQRKYLELLRSNTERIGAFTNQFLDLAKIEAGRMVFRTQLTDMEQLVEGPVENAAVVGGRNNITVSCESAPVPQVNVDQEKMMQVVHNLLSNALKYTPEGGTVTVRVGPNGNGVRVTVSDTGVGIDPVDIPHLFKKFYQAKNVGKARSKGTGIGLALVKAIVEGHGGSVHVASTPGKGSTFIVDLPSSAPREPAPEMKESVG